MSKFATMMHLVDKEHKEIKERRYEGNTRPFHRQDVCVLRLNLPKLNPMCENCQFCSVVSTHGKVDEMGIGGYMSDQEDGLKAVKHNPAAGVNLRDPRTIIIADGQAYACANREQTKAGTFFVGEDDPRCSNFKEKMQPEERKKK